MGSWLDFLNTAPETIEKATQILREKCGVSGNVPGSGTTSKPHPPSQEPNPKQGGAEDDESKKAQADGDDGNVFARALSQVAAAPEEVEGEQPDEEEEIGIGMQ